MHVLLIISLLWKCLQFPWSTLLWSLLETYYCDIWIGTLPEEIIVYYPLEFQSAQISYACRDYKLQALQLVDSKKKEVQVMNLEYKEVTEITHVTWKIVMLATVVYFFF